MNTQMSSVDGFQSVAVMSLIHGQPARTYGKKRVCAFVDCGTRLSMYNPMNKCSIHELIA
jgi:hypothetical protein